MMKKFSGNVLVLAAVFSMIHQGMLFAEELNTYNLDEVLVTESRLEKEKEMNTPAATEIFTKEDIKNYNGSNVQEILEYATGAIAAQPTGVGSTFGMRGLTGASRNPTILIDGVPLNMQGFGNLDAIPVNAVERIEIIRGTGAVLYGTDTLTGVINIITKKSQQVSMSAGYGSRGKRLASLNANGDKFGVSYSHDRVAERNWYTSSKTSKGRWMEKNSALLKYTPNDNFAFRYLITDNQNTYDKFQKSKPNGNNDTTIAFHDLNMVYRNKGINITLFGQQRKYENDYYNNSGTLVPKSSLRRKSYNYGADTRYNFKTGKYDITTGLEIALEADSHGNVKGTSFDLDMIKRHRKAIYFQVVNDVNDKTQFSFGGREVMYDKIKNEFLPSFQILHKLSKKDSLFFNVNKSFRIPTIGDQYSDSDAVIFNDDLGPEIGWNYEIGWKKLLSDREMLKLSLYHLDIDNRIYTQKIDDDHSMVVNANKFKNTGVELSYEGQLNEQWKLKTAVAFSDPKQNNKPGDAFQRCDDKLLINSVLTYKTGKITSNLLHQYAAMRYNAFNPQSGKGIKQYLSFNTTYKFDKENSVKFAVNNLLNRTEEMAASRGTLLPCRDWFISYERNF